jgi:glycosyltransferase involved in cell wall biosynthesis
VSGIQKLIMLNSLYYPDEKGGAEVVVRQLSEALVQKKTEVVVLALCSGNEQREELVGAVRVIRVPLGNIYWPFGNSKRASAPMRALWHALDIFNPLMAARVGRILRTERPDLIHFHNITGFSASAIWAAKQLNLPVVQTLHDYHYVCSKSDMFRNGRSCEISCMVCRYHTFIRRRLAQDIDCVCGVSLATLNRVLRNRAFQGSRQQWVVHNIGAPEPPIRERRRSSDITRIGYLGRLLATKGVEVLIAATRELLDSRIELLVAGDGPPSYRAELERRAIGLPIRFLGRTSIAEFFPEIEVLVVPSIWEEPFPRVIQEAFAYGVPVIGSNVGGIPEAIGSDSCGACFNAGDVHDLTRRIREFLVRRDSEDFFNNCIARSKAFTSEMVLPRQMQIYELAIADRHNAIARQKKR